MKNEELKLELDIVAPMLFAVVPNYESETWDVVCHRSTNLEYVFKKGCKILDSFDSIKEAAKWARKYADQHNTSEAEYDVFDVAYYVGIQL